MDDPVLQEKLLLFRQGQRAIVRFRLPAIHCSACVWLLERLPQFQEGVWEVRVNLSRREAELQYDPETVSLSTLAVQLERLGYAPSVNRADMDRPALRERLRDPLLKRLGVAGFCAGNIMLLSFPDYLDWDAQSAGPLMAWITGLKILLALPVLFYSGSVYWRSAWVALRRRVPSVDIPIALGMLALSGRSFYDLATGTGPGYLDSLAGLVFLLLIGRWFQDRVYGFLSFERDFRSFFPAAVQKIEGDRQVPVLPDALIPGDEIRVRPGEIVPADAILLEPARLDYHFITGESQALMLGKGAKVYGGGRVLDQPVRVQVERPLASGYLASMWSRDALRRQTTADAGVRDFGETATASGRYTSRMTRLTDRFSRAFTPLVLVLAFGSLLFWWPAGPHKALEILTAVLIVACPCGLALAAPFALGHALRYFDRAGLHLRDASAIERMAVLDTLVFDKTGTLTLPGTGTLHWTGRALSTSEREAIAGLAGCSAHPLSVRLASEWGSERIPELNEVREHTGKGIEGVVNGHAIRIGSTSFCGLAGDDRTPDVADRHINVQLDGQVPGYFTLHALPRQGIRGALQRLADMGTYRLELLSGDQPSSRSTVEELFPNGASLQFGVSPHQKLERMEMLQAAGYRVGMFGDGLNDAGALAAADVGLAVSDDLSGYFPASDGVLEAGALCRLPELLGYARAMRQSVWIAIGVSMAYNVVGLSFAMSGLLTPLVAAILMPISSLSVAAIGLALATWWARPLMTMLRSPYDERPVLPEQSNDNLPAPKYLPV